MSTDAVIGGDLSQAEASEILGMSERTFRRWRERYEAEGAVAEQECQRLYKRLRDLGEHIRP